MVILYYLENFQENSVKATLSRKMILQQKCPIFKYDKIILWGMIFWVKPE